MSVKRPDQDLIFQVSFQVCSGTAYGVRRITHVWQLYVNRDRKASEKLIQNLEKDGFKAIMLTVDAAVPGNREIDRRAKGFTVRASVIPV